MHSLIAKSVQMQCQLRLLLLSAWRQKHNINHWFPTYLGTCITGEGGGSESGEGTSFLSEPEKYLCNLTIYINGVARTLQKSHTSKGDYWINH